MKNTSPKKKSTAGRKDNLKPVVTAAAKLKNRGMDLKQRPNRLLKDSELFYRSLFDNMESGVAYCKMIYEKGQPQDFRYLDVNGAFESLTGLNDVAGKKVSDVIPGIRESDAGLFKIYGRVAKTGKPDRFETYLEAMKMWFSVSVFSPQKEYFVAVFDVITERKQAQDALLRSAALQREMSIRDHLTGLFNRRYMEETLERELLRASRKNLSIGIIMLDVDDLKQFNDTYGHAAGDEILRVLGAMQLRHVRGDDIPCRYGGDEFMIVLPDASLEITRERAQCLCDLVRQLNFHFGKRPLEDVTISVGVAVYPKNGTTSVDVLRAADNALYRAKREGHGRVVVA
jgi:diguanylate cyclase (GGDEF)-like protein